MKKTNYIDDSMENCTEICPVIYTLDIIGQKWKIPILWNISQQGSVHYNELKRLVSSITNTALTRSLRELEESDLVLRTNHNTIPPSVEYSLTERGKSLMPILQSMYDWGLEQQSGH